jgi:hypothetical protein
MTVAPEARSGDAAPEVVAPVESVVIRTKLSPEAVVEELNRAARRGKVPGLRADGSKRGATGEFEVSDFGRPFESVLHGRVTREGEESVIRFESRVKPLVPVIFVVILVVTVWPGILLTDSMLKMYFSWYTIPTWWWYLPMTVPFSPWAFMKAWKQSKGSAAAEGAEIVKAVGEVVGQGGGTV